MTENRKSAGMIEPLKEKMAAAIRALDAQPGKTVDLFHHNDADGLSSAAILTRAFSRAGYRVQRVCLEKTYPDVLKHIFKSNGRILVFADFAGRIAPMLSELNHGRNLILILDHHVAQEPTDSNTYNLDPELFGLKGDRDISASTTCYLFSCILDPANQDMAHLAVIGAIGDGFFVDNRLAGPNRDAAREAVRQGTLEIRPEGSGEGYFYRSSRGMLLCEALSGYLNTFGGAGYYQGGPEMGVRVCLEGFSPESDLMLKALKQLQTKAFDAEIKKIRFGGLLTTPNIQWFHVRNRFSPMGVKMIGEFCDILKNSDFIDPKRYIAGFQTHRVARCSLAS